MLSKIIIFVTRHNRDQIKALESQVVNCFQKLLSSWHDTTGVRQYLSPKALWIAFKNYYLRDTTQLIKTTYKSISRCELLSKIIIFVTRHNNVKQMFQLDWVVNCFQKLLSSWHDTTGLNRFLPVGQLWIAFKNYYLRDTTQLTIKNWG